MEFNNDQDFENNKEMDNVNSQKKKLSFLLLPKKDYHINREKFNFNNDDINIINEKRFYKTSGKGFSFGRDSKKSFTNNFKNPKSNNFNQKRIRSSTIDNKKLFNLNKNKNDYFINKDDDDNIVKILQKRINEIENELEHNENTFSYNQKMMQKKIDEKEQVIKKLSKKLEDVTENNKKDSETNINNLKKKLYNKNKRFNKRK